MLLCVMYNYIIYYDDRYYVVLKRSLDGEYIQIAIDLSANAPPTLQYKYNIQDGGAQLIVSTAGYIYTL